VSRFLCIDIGAGTMDMLWYDTDSVHHYKAVAVSPVRTIALQAAGLPGDLVVTGCEMGGGPITTVLRERAKTHRVVASASSAATLHHDPGKVRGWGITVVDDLEAERLVGREGTAHLVLRDLEPGRIESLIAGLGVPFEFDAVLVCAQDHGSPPPGTSHLDFRHRIYRSRLEHCPHPHALLFSADEVPPELNRLRAIAQTAGRLPTAAVYVMDSGMAAVTGAAQDWHARRARRFTVLDVATSHTVCAALADGELAAMVEYHTADITRERLEALLVDLAAGTLDHRSVLAEGGHGAVVRAAAGPEALETIIATGPKRRLVHGSRLPMVYGAPLGDNMLTGCVGMLEALRLRLGMPEIVYL
jgi:uncharacterized protein (DUF1786 family)